MTQAMLLLAGGAAVLMMTGGVVSLVSGGGADQKRLKRRLTALSAPRTATRAPERALSKAEPRVGFGTATLRSIQGLIGYDSHVPSRPLPSWLVCAVALGIARGVTWLIVAIAGDLGWFAYPFVVLIIVRSYFVWTTKRWRTALFKQFPDALSTIVRAVRVGVSMPEAIGLVAKEAPEPTAAIFAEIASTLAIGTTLTEAMAASTAKTGVPEYRFFTTALVLQSRTGGGLAATLDGLADVIRKRVMVRARGKALASEARASGAVLALLPVATVGMMMVMSPDYMGPLFSTPMGHKLLAAAALCEGGGIFVMRTMIARALS